MPKTTYIDRKKLKLSRKQFEEVIKKDPKSAEILKKEKEGHDKLTEKLKTRKQKRRKTSRKTKFSLTPLDQRKYLWDSANNRYEYYAYLVHFGGYIGFDSTHSLEGQYNSNRVCISTNNVGFPFPDPFPSDFSDRAVAVVSFKTDAKTDKQYRLLFHVRCISKVGVYLNGNLVRDVDCDGDETISILVDCPGPGIMDRVYIAPEWNMWMKGIDCYVI